MYQINDLRTAMSSLEEAVTGLSMSIDWAEKDEMTVEHGLVPLVDYSLKFQNSSIGITPVVVASREIAETVRNLLGDPEDAEIVALIEAIENCPVK